MEQRLRKQHRQVSKTRIVNKYVDCKRGQLVGTVPNHHMIGDSEYPNTIFFILGWFERRNGHCDQKTYNNLFMCETKAVLAWPERYYILT